MSKKFLSNSQGLTLSFHHVSSHASQKKRWKPTMSGKVTACLNRGKQLQATSNWNLEIPSKPFTPIPARQVDPCAPLPLLKGGLQAFRGVTNATWRSPFSPFLHFSFRSDKSLSGSQLEILLAFVAAPELWSTSHYQGKLSPSQRKGWDFLGGYIWICKALSSTFSSSLIRINHLWRRVL